MISVYKYVIPFDEHPVIEMHSPNKYLSVDNQNEQLCLWTLIRTDNPIKPVEFRLVGTGHSFDDAYHHNYIGSAQFQGGLYVWHLFERVK